jgi:hypothetical protein
VLPREGVAPTDAVSLLDPQKPGPRVNDRWRPKPPRTRAAVRGARAKVVTRGSVFVLVEQMSGGRVHERRTGGDYSPASASRIWACPGSPPDPAQITVPFAPTKNVVGIQLAWKL